MSLADRTPFAIGGLELLNRAFSIHLYEADLEKGQLASVRFAPEWIVRPTGTRLVCRRR